MATTFQDYGWSLSTVLSFKYLGWVLNSSGYDWIEVVSDLRKYQQQYFSQGWVGCPEL